MCWSRQPAGDPGPDRQGINLTFNIASSALGQIEAKQLIALAVCSNRASTVLPEVPPWRKPTVPDFDAGLWLGLLRQPDAKAGDRHARRRRDKAMHAPAGSNSLAEEGSAPLDASR